MSSEFGLSSQLSGHYKMYLVQVVAALRVNELTAAGDITRVLELVEKD
jgi:hypothetical protein